MPKPIDLKNTLQILRKKNTDNDSLLSINKFIRDSILNLSKLQKSVICTDSVKNNTKIFINHFDQCALDLRDDDRNEANILFLKNQYLGLIFDSGSLSRALIQRKELYRLLNSGRTLNEIQFKTLERLNDDLQTFIHILQINLEVFNNPKKLLPCQLERKERFINILKSLVIELDRIDSIEGALNDLKTAYLSNLSPVSSLAPLDGPISSSQIPSIIQEEITPPNPAISPPTASDSAPQKFKDVFNAFLNDQSENLKNASVGISVFKAFITDKIKVFPAEKEEIQNKSQEFEKITPIVKAMMAAIHSESNWDYGKQAKKEKLIGLMMDFIKTPSVDKLNEFMIEAKRSRNPFSFFSTASYTAFENQLKAENIDCSSILSSLKSSTSPSTKN